MLSLISANGGGGWNQQRDYTGSGGRVVLRYATDLGFNEELVIAHGGPSSATGAKLGGAGTVYIQQMGESGDLKISNIDPVTGQTVSSAQTTPVEVLGKHYIENITEVETNNWLIQISGTLEPHRNYAGYLIDPDASDVDGPYYTIIGTQSENELLVYSENDLWFSANEDLVGVHEFGKLQIEGGASMDFGWDRPLVPHADAIAITPDLTELQAGSFIGWENVDWPPGFNLTLNGNSAIYEWRLSNMSWNLTLNGDLEVAQDMAIRSQDMAITIQADAIYVGGDATFSGVAPDGFVTVATPLLDVAGVLYFDEGSQYLPKIITGYFTEDFEDANIDGWTSTGAIWSATTDAAHAGSYSAGSRNIGGGRWSYIQRTLETSGTLTFWWKVSIVSKFDYLRFYINGIPQDSIFGTTSWQREEYSVSEGDEIRWSFYNYSSFPGGSNKGWIDDVSLEE